MSQLATAQVVQEHPHSFLSSSFNTFVKAREIRSVDSCRLNLSTYIRKNTGLFSDVYQTDTHLGYNTKRSTISAQFYSDKQGELIARNRFYLHYITRIKLNKKATGFAGLGAGAVNKSLGNNSTSSQGTATVFDASALLGIYSECIISMISINQIPQSVIQPINFEVPLLRYYQFYFNASSKSYEDFILSGVGMINYYSSHNIEFIGGVQVAYMRKYAIGMEFSSMNVANYFIDVQVYSGGQYSVSALMSYETSHAITKQMNGSFSIFNGGVVVKVK